MSRAMLFVVAVAALVTGTASQAVTFSISASCLSDCAAAGLADGGALGGRIELDDSSFAPNGFVNNTNLQDFSLRFGSNRVSSAGVLAANIFGQWDPPRAHQLLHGRRDDAGAHAR